MPPTFHLYLMRQNTSVEISPSNELQSAPTLKLDGEGLIGEPELGHGRTGIILLIENNVGLWFLRSNTNADGRIHLEEMMGGEGFLPLAVYFNRHQMRMKNRAALILICKDFE